MNTQDLFEHSFVINLDGRKNRLEKFQDRFNKTGIEVEVKRFQAFNGKKIGQPDQWNGDGAFGCYLSHLVLMETALNNEWNYYTVFEDDADFLPGFKEKLSECLKELPDDWGWFYLGGQMLLRNDHPVHRKKPENERLPIPYSDHLVIPWEVNRTHAMAFNLKSAGKKIAKHWMDWSQWGESNLPLHIDHWSGELHRLSYEEPDDERSVKVFAPRNGWLVDQALEKSDIASNPNLSSSAHDWGWKRERQYKENGIEILSHRVGYGTIGLGGDCGYEFKKIKRQESGRTWISAHSPAEIKIRTTKYFSVFGALNSGVESKSPVRMVVDGISVGEFCNDKVISEEVLLSPGEHTIEFFSNGRNRAHSLIGFRERNNACFSIEKMKVGYGIKSPLPKENGDPIGYQSIKIDADEGTETVFLSAHSPSEIVIKTTKPAVLFGCQNGDVDAVCPQTLTVNGEEIGTVQKAKSKTKEIEIGVGRWTINFDADTNEKELDGTKYNRAHTLAALRFPRNQEISLEVK